MQNKDIINSLTSLKGDSKKRNFVQTIDLIINLKDVNIKKNDEQIDLFQALPHSPGRKIKVCGIVGEELLDQAKEVFDKTIFIVDAEELKNKKREIKKLANQYDFFVAQANIMPKVAAIFGRVLGPRRKMPNPKVGCVVPPKANLKQLKERLTKTVRISAVNNPVIQLMVGKEDQDENQVAENIMQVYNNLVHHLPKERHNIKSVYLKLTMGKPVQVKL